MKQKQPPTQPSIVTILINWNAFKDTEECIQSLLKADYPANSIVIVDNASTDDSLARLKEEFGSRVHFIENKKNLGFTGANNKGFGYALKNGFDYVFVLNNDTVVDRNIFREFISCFTASIFFFSDAIFSLKFWFKPFSLRTSLIPLVCFSV